MDKIEAGNLTRKGAGRPKGSVNKTPALLKEAILMAAEAAGNVGGGTGGIVAYLKTQALANPGPFMALMGKVLPLQVNGPGDGGEHIVKFVTIYEGQ